MRTRIQFLNTLAILVLVVSACATWAQTGTGIYPFGAYDGLGTDTINIGNLNAHLSFPVINKPGRGLPFYYNLNYDSLIWTPTTVNGTQVWSLAPDAGWRGETETTTGYLSYLQTQTTVRNSGGICITATERLFVYHDPFGVAHSFPGVQDTIKTGTGSCTGGSEKATGVAADNSGYAINIAAVGGMQVIAKDGHVFVPPQNATTGLGTVTDSNGNEISTDGQGNFTDTLGLVALAVTGSSSSAQRFAYKDTLGSPQRVVVNYGPYTVQTAFGCSGIGEYGPEVTQLVSSIAFPDGSTYTFNYEHTPGVSGNVTGRLLSVTLPTGGTISYAYSGSNNGISCVDGSAMGLTRTLTNDPAGSTRSYTRTIGTTTSSTAVVDGLHNALNYSFVATSNGPYETQRQEYNGASTGTAD
jgi:hypothetical protein